MLSSAEATRSRYEDPAFDPIRLLPADPVSLDDRLSRGKLRGVEAKNHVFMEGDIKAFVYKVETGTVCLYTVLPDGRRQVVAFAYPGELIGLGFDRTEAYSAQATVSTRIKCLPIAALRQMALQDPRIAIRMIEALTQQLSVMRAHLTCLGQQCARERLVNFLLALSNRNLANGDDPQTVELRMTRKDIGDFLGLTIETVSRLLTKLRTEGLIAIEGGSTVRLVDSTWLEGMGHTLRGN